MISQPRLIQTYLTDGTLEGIRVVERQGIFAKSTDHGDYVELTDNVALKSPNHAGHIVTGRAVNAWTTWKNSAGQTMDELMRRSE